MNFKSTELIRENARLVLKEYTDRTPHLTGVTDTLLDQRLNRCDWGRALSTQGRMQFKQEFKKHLAQYRQKHAQEKK